MEQSNKILQSHSMQQFSCGRCIKREGVGDTKAASGWRKERREEKHSLLLGLWCIAQKDMEQRPQQGRVASG